MFTLTGKNRDGWDMTPRHQYFTEAEAVSRAEIMKQDRHLIDDGLALIEVIDPDGFSCFDDFVPENCK